MYFESKLVSAATCDVEDLSAVIYRSDSGGPVRMIINGRKSIPTGLYLSVKGGWRQMPWESRDGELAAMHVAEFSSGVTALLSQPHRLEIKTTRLARPYEYFPDLELSVTAELLGSLLRGVPFGQAALDASDLEVGELTTIILEMKGQDDPRMRKKDYLRKLELAELVYAAMGIPFFVMQQDEHLVDAIVARVTPLVPDARVAIADTDIWIARQHLAAKGGRSSYAAMTKALGGTAKLHALHVRRIIRIDLSRDIGPSSFVSANVTG